MTQPLPKYSLTACLTWLAAGIAWAAPGDGDHHRQHGSHVHGQSELTLAVEYDRLEIGFESPAANLTGFEHRATTPEQVRTLEAVRTALESPQTLFVFTGSRCSLEHADIDTAALSQTDELHHHEAADGGHHDADHHGDEHHDEEHDGDGHHEEEHHSDDRRADGHHDEEHHNDEHGDEHHDEEHHGDGHDHEKSDSDAQTHSEISASYHFQCQDTADLESISVDLFDLFEGVEEINAMWITDGGQGAARLTPRDRVIQLR